MEKNPVQFFHGTTKDIPKGGKVVPAGKGNASVHGSHGYRSGQRSDEHAFATEKENEAWEYADMATRDRKNQNAAPKGRARVYTVGDASDSKIGRHHPAHPANTKNKFEVWHEHASKKGFPVTGRIDIKPGHQGTLPIDWTPHANGSHADVNHPNDENVEFGHQGSKMFNVSAYNHFSNTRENKEHAERAREMTHPEGHPVLGLQWGNNGA